ncbi:MAG: Obg family GTPase CgtA [Patescibacteria group bacterium]|nr:Obg family GTPase CgtA [Patescibacteria group bacterium]MDE1946116.1 Obg family GTPase CgtA [Patescibacteria group bacterium]
MAFIDELKIHIRAGNGGDGVVRWRHEKGKDKAGPSGGNGGKGGDVYLHAIRDIAVLARYKNEKEFAAENGESGMKKSMHGRNGKDLVIDLPIGSVVTNLETRETFNLVEDEKEIKVLNGGKGGLGNEYFKSATNVKPENQTDGKRGEEADFHIELQLVADAGLIGLPNAGKSSLLNALTNAKSKIGAYQFTTLEPYLGDMHGYILADIPGLIEGASEGRGLGHKFLRHIKRTKMLFHLISLENEDVAKAYKVIRAELAAYSDDLAEKKEVVILTKTDETDTKKIEKAKKKIEKFNKNILTVSILDDASVKKLKDNLIKVLRKAAK